VVFALRKEAREAFPKQKKGAARRGRPRRKKYLHGLVTIMVMVIPIALAAPAVSVFIPPAAPLVPTVLAGFMQLMPRTIRLSAVPAVMLYGFVEFVVRLGNAALATIVVFGGRSGCSWKCQQAQKRCRYEQGPC